MSSRHRIRLLVAYDGSDFRGWAPQRGQRTVHGTLTEAVRRVSGEDCEIVGASRTDSGAHAIGAICHFDVEVPIPVERWPRILNMLLPRDLVVKDAKEVAPEFHSRFWALSRWYRYRIQCGEPDPRRSRYVFYHPRPFDVELMNRAAQHLVGVHDFLAFSQMMDRDASTVREVIRISVKRVRDEAWIDVVGTAFCRGMMRRISGALWEVGYGRSDPEELASLLDKKCRGGFRWPVLLPAAGLTLMRVAYGRHPSDQRPHRRNVDEDDT